MPPHRARLSAPGFGNAKRLFGVSLFFSHRCPFLIPACAKLVARRGSCKLMIFSSPRRNWGGFLHALNNYSTDMNRGFIIGGICAFVVVAVSMVFAWHVLLSSPVRATAIVKGPPAKDELSQVSGVTRSPDGNILATVSNNRSIRLWDAKTGALLHILEGEHREWLDSPAFSPDGSLLATTSSVSALNQQLGRIQFWNPATGERLNTVDGMDWPKSVKFDPIGNFIVVGTVGDIFELDSTSYSVIGHVSRPFGSRTLSTMEFDPTGTYLATAGQDGSVRLWKMPLLEPARTFDAGTPVVKVGIPGEGNSPIPVASVAFSREGGLLAAENQEGTVFVWEIASGNEVRRYSYGQLKSGESISSAVANSLAFTADDRWLIATDRTRTGIRLLGVAANKELPTTLSTHSDSQILAFDASLLDNSIAFVYRAYQPNSSKFEIWSLHLPQ